MSTGTRTQLTEWKTAESGPSREERRAEVLEKWPGHPNPDAVLDARPDRTCPRCGARHPRPAPELCLPCLKDSLEERQEKAGAIVSPLAPPADRVVPSGGDSGHLSWLGPLPLPSERVVEKVEE